MKIEELEEIIKGRRSVRRWKNQEVSEDVLVRAVETATWAPNGGNFQGWRFKVVTNRELIVRMADAVQSVADKIASWPEAECEINGIELVGETSGSELEWVGYGF